MLLHVFEKVRFGLAALFLVVVASSAWAAPYAELVMDARTGKVLHSRNANARLHPASLTKMMTLYITFEAIRRGEITLDTKVRISKNAAAEPPSKLDLKAGQRIALRYLIRAAAIKSANDAATAIGEAIAGSESAFAKRMTRTAKALGMKRTTFKNAHGLTASGHLSTAHDMSILGRHLIYDYPQYYNLFSRQSTDAGIRKVSNTNRRLLQNYKGADGIKTGYTRAAGFNLVASAERGRERVIATVFGGQSTASRNARVAQLLDLGFKKAPTRVALRKPRLPKYGRITQSNQSSKKQVSKSITLARSIRPAQRPESTGTPDADIILAIAQDAEQNLGKAKVELASLQPKEKPIINVEQPVAKAIVAPVKRPQSLQTASLTPVARDPAPKPKVITRASTSGGRHWGISLGKYASRSKAERVLLQTALQELETLDEALRKVVNRPQGWEANFVGMTRDRAKLACARLNARGMSCETRGPSS